MEIVILFICIIFLMILLMILLILMLRKERLTVKDKNIFSKDILTNNICNLTIYYFLEKRYKQYIQIS
mgnify:CR=1 FL=1